MSSTPVSETLIEALSADESVDLEGKTVNDYIDLDAIDALASNESYNWHLGFTAGNETVEIDSEGWLTIGGREYRWGDD